MYEVLYAEIEVFFSVLSEFQELQDPEQGRGYGLYREPSPR